MKKDLPVLALAFYKGFFNDLTQISPTSKKDNMLSLRYLQKRYRCEGIKFVTKSLPELGKAVETSLITGDPLKIPCGFTKSWRSQVSCFMSNYMDMLFDTCGVPKWKLRLSDEENHTEAYAFWAIRQVCMAFSKVTDVPPMVTSSEAIKAFEQRVTSDLVISAPSWLLSDARKLIERVVMDDGRLHAMLTQWAEEPYGAHGPGAVAGKEKGLEKWMFERVKGADLKLYQFRPSFLDQLDFLEYGSFAPMGEATPYSRATCVPKDFRSPRVICIEPKEFQFAQQGLWRVLKSLIHRDPLTRRSINFVHQDFNARLCKRRDLATIDLKDASDTVMLKLCRILFPRDFFKLVTRYRSRGILSNGNILKPTCFASMGSALCFPVETLVFWAIAQSAVHPLDKHLPVRVFGDDIVVPKGSARFVVKMLEACGFKVNVGKTCIETPIRESCGAYTYSGVDIRIVRLKTVKCSNHQEWLSHFQSGKLLLQSFATKAGLAVLGASEIVHSVPYGYFGIPKCSGRTKCQSRWNPELQRTEVLLPARAMRVGCGRLPGDAGLYAWLVGNQTKPSSYGTEKVKMKWVSSDITNV